jgi:hypothetical protein
MEDEPERGIGFSYKMSLKDGKERKSRPQEMPSGHNP